MRKLKKNEAQDHSLGRLSLRKWLCALSFLRLVMARVLLVVLLNITKYKLLLVYSANYYVYYLFYFKIIITLFLFTSILKFLLYYTFYVCQIILIYIFYIFILDLIICLSFFNTMYTFIVFVIYMRLLSLKMYN